MGKLNFAYSLSYLKNNNLRQNNIRLNQPLGQGEIRFFF